MGISMGNTGRKDMSEINMTPMIDVLLVLLVIFMIAQPMLQKTMDVQLPKEEQSPDQAPPAAQIILQIFANGQYKINMLDVPKAQLSAKLNEIYANRPSKIMFVKAEEEVIYQDVIAALDAARGAGVKVIGAVLPDQEAALGL